MKLSRLSSGIIFLSVVLCAVLMSASSEAAMTTSAYSHKAVEAYRKAVELNASLVSGIEDPELIRRLGEGFLEEGAQFVSAGNLLEAERQFLLAGNFIQTSELYSQLARCYFRQERWKRAIVVYRKALLKAPSSHRLKAEMAQAYGKTGRVDVATNLFCEALLEDFSCASLVTSEAVTDRVVGELVRTARQQAKNGRHDDAASRLRVAIQLNASPDVYAEIGDAHLKAERFVDAARAYGLAVIEKPSLASRISSDKMRVLTAKALFDQGVEAHQANELDKARSLFERSLELDKRGPTYYNLADCAIRQKRLDEALDLYNKALDDDPSLTDAYLNLAIIYMDRDQSEKSIECLRNLITRKPNDGAAYELLAKAFIKAGSHEDAAQAYRAAVEYEPGLQKYLTDKNLRSQAAELLYKSAVAQFQAKQLRESIDEIGAAKALHHKGKHDFLLGNAHYALGELNEALAAYTEASRYLPNKPEIPNNVGNILLKQGKHKQAIATFRLALELKPSYPQAYNNLGICLRKQGLIQEAIAAYKKALSLKPDYATAYYNLGNAYAALDNHIRAN